MSPSDKQAKDQEQRSQQAGAEAASAVMKKHETKPDPDELREEIQETREELGATVEALAEKADVKAQAQEKVDEIKSDAQQKVGAVTQQAQENRTPLIAGGAFLAALLLLWLIRRD